MVAPAGRAPGDVSPRRTSAGRRGLRATLDELNAARAAGIPGKHNSSMSALLQARHRADHQLAVYGSLAPGGRNHGVLKPLGGNWRPGTVRGRYYSSGWGAGGAYPGVYLDNSGSDVSVKLLTTELLASDWGRLDAFEGDEYLRLLTVVSFIPTGYTIANIYALQSDPET